MQAIPESLRSTIGTQPHFSQQMVFQCDSTADVDSWMQALTTSLQCHVIEPPPGLLKVVQALKEAEIARQKVQKVKLSPLSLSASSYSHPHTLPITCTCCHDEIKGTQDQDLFSCSFSNSLLALSSAPQPLIILSPSASLASLASVVKSQSLGVTQPLHPSLNGA